MPRRHVADMRVIDVLAGAVVDVRHDSLGQPIVG
jgi:hypothetical protein